MEINNIESTKQITCGILNIIEQYRNSTAISNDIRCANIILAINSMLDSSIDREICHYDEKISGVVYDIKDATCEFIDAIEYITSGRNNNQTEQIEYLAIIHQLVAKITNGIHVLFDFIHNFKVGDMQIECTVIRLAINNASSIIKSYPNIDEAPGYLLSKVVPLVKFLDI